ncbi:MAG: 50S ribosomal protein L10 [Bacteroidetes bacterium CG2_30_32_10]|nr:MAG: 50S ribosomal protein L10 [Bacteroidetes bacterium CG2_30_32_10]
MKKEEKNQMIDSLITKIANNNYIYITDISDLNVETTSKLRRLCFKRNITLQVVKNSLLKKAMERSNKNFDTLYDVLKGSTSIMLSDTGNLPAKLIKEFRKGIIKKPILKGAYIEEMCFVGDDKLDTLINIKSKNEVIADIISALQSPAKNVISALQSSGNKLAGIVKTLSEKEN